MHFGMLALPVILSAVAVFVAASVIWMFLPHHKSDFRGLPAEEEFRAVFLKHGVGRGMYRIPSPPDGAAMKSPEFQKKVHDGPLATLMVQDAGDWRMGRRMLQSLAYYLAVSFLVAYLARHSVRLDSTPRHVFRMVTTFAWVAYGVGSFPDAIWFGRSWSATWKGVADALVYAVITGAIFMWLWPAKP